MYISHIHVYGYVTQWCGLHGLNSSSDLQFCQPLFQAFRDCSLYAKYYWYHYYLHVPQLLYLSGKIQVFVSLFAFFHFHSMLEQQNPVDEKFFFSG